MPIQHAIWKVATQPQPLVESSLATERLLEEMIVADPRVLSDEWMLIGRQEDTGFGGRIDLSAIAPDGALVLIELKRDRTPRYVVAQALDYAGRVETPGSWFSLDFHRGCGKMRPRNRANSSGPTMSGFLRGSG
jgi:RecB family endonuclease NucS